MIDTAKYGITAADYVAPFTASMYEVAYKNGVGIQNAIDDAKANGQRDLVIPAGNYPVCYSGDVDLCNYPIINACGVNLFGYGVKLYVIYDEVGTNPYFTGETPRTLQGTIIVTDSDVRGFHLVGERRYRLDENAKYREGSCGIGLMPYTRGNVIADCICELFSGDGIGCSKYMEQISGWENDTFTSVDWDANTSSFVESTKVFTSSVHGGDWIDQTKPLLLRCTGYFLYSSAPLKILCFDENEELLGTVRFWQGEYFYLLPGTAKWYLQVIREADHDVTATETWSYWIGNAYYCDTLIENCKSRFNQRGGMSNLPTNTTVRNCEIHHNGCAYDGMPAFYDGTQFGIDIEDVYIHNISIEGCNIYANTHAVLYRCWGIRFKDCYLQGYVNSLNFCSDFFAENTTFGLGCTMTTPTPFGSKTAIGCKFGGSKAAEIIELDKGVITSATVAKTGVVSFYTKPGEVAFEVDLSSIIDIKYELIKEGLEIGIDFTALAVGATAFDMTYGGGTATASANMITENGAVPVGYGNYVTITDNETDFSANEFTIEFFALGFGYHCMRSVTGNYDIIETHASGTVIGTSAPVISVNLPYNNGSKIHVNSIFEFVYCGGEVTTANLTNIPDLECDKYAHVVIVGKADGSATAYINGYESVDVMQATDFVSWDTSEFSKYYLQGAQPSTTQAIKHHTIYNRALSQEEIKYNQTYYKKLYGIE